MHNDVSFVVQRAHDLRRVAPRPSHFEQALRGAASQLDLLLPNQCAELLGAPHLFVSHQQLVETQPQRAACRVVEAPQLGAA